MSRLSCLLLVLTLMACSAASTKKEIKEGKVIASKDESMVDSAAPPKEDMDIGKMLANADTSKTRRSLFGIGRLIQQKINNKKKLFSTIVAKKKSIKNKILSKLSTKYWY